MTAFAQGYYDWIRWVVDMTHLSDEVLHIHAGMAVLLIARVVTGRSLGSFVPLAFVLVAEVVNEALDSLAHGSWQWADTRLDLFNTLLWPVVLCVAIRLRPAVVTPRKVED
ncbi:hypothetical protein [Sphingomonas sp.]|jgi:hypothetical protein|uniref:hypothetical protein n=1 Tax=Sphingomonas sp. TaxID=28214 RepID=UPI002D7F5BF1|nr:hypothetical protein [Sphingomonas sp.]HEU0044510.1 hypothetical protein [Sphingomonas sp.]